MPGPAQVSDPAMAQSEQVLGGQPRAGDVVIRGDVDFGQVRLVRAGEHDGDIDWPTRSIAATGVGGTDDDQTVDPLGQQRFNGIPADSLIQVAVGEHRRDTDGVERGGQPLEQGDEPRVAQIVEHDANRPAARLRQAPGDAVGAIVQFRHRRQDDVPAGGADVRFLTQHA